MPKTRFRCTTNAEVHEALRQDGILDIFGTFDFEIRSNSDIIIHEGSPIIRIREAHPNIYVMNRSAPLIHIRGSSTPTIRTFHSSRPKITISDSSSPLIESHDSSEFEVAAWDSSNPRVIRHDASSSVFSLHNRSHVTELLKGDIALGGVESAPLSSLDVLLSDEV